MSEYDVAMDKFWAKYPYLSELERVQIYGDDHERMMAKINEKKSEDTKEDLLHAKREREYLSGRYFIDEPLVDDIPYWDIES